MSFLFIVNFVWVSSTLQVSFLASEMSRFVIEKTELLAVVNDGYSVLIRGYYQMMKINSGGGWRCRLFVCSPIGEVLVALAENVVSCASCGDAMINFLRSWSIWTILFERLLKLKVSCHLLYQRLKNTLSCHLPNYRVVGCYWDQIFVLKETRNLQVFLYNSYICLAFVLLLEWSITLVKYGEYFSFSCLFRLLFSSTFRKCQSYLFTMRRLIAKVHFFSFLDRHFLVRNFYEQGLIFVDIKEALS